MLQSGPCSRVKLEKFHFKNNGPVRLSCPAPVALHPTQAQLYLLRQGHKNNVGTRNKALFQVVCVSSMSTQKSKDILDDPSQNVDRFVLEDKVCLCGVRIPPMMIV